MYNYFDENFSIYAGMQIMLYIEQVMNAGHLVMLNGIF